MAKIRCLFIGPPQINLELHSRAINAVGGEMTRIQPGDTGTLIEALKDVDVAIAQGHAMDPEVFKHMGNNGRCKGLVAFGHGFDALDLGAASENGVLLANTASFGTEEVSNQAMMLFLVCSRKFVLHDKLVKSGTWTREHLPPMGHISGQTMGIVGIGDIGRAFGRKAKAFGMHILAYDPFVASWDFKEYGFEAATSLEEVCRRADYISLHVFLNPHTHHMMSTKQFELMKPTAYLINCSRGPVVDEEALIEALKTGQIAGAGLDVFDQEPVQPDNPLLKMDNVAATNHYASYSEVAWLRAQTQAGEEAVRIATGSLPMEHINPGVVQQIGAWPRAKMWEVYLEELKARQ